MSKEHKGMFLRKFTKSLLANIFFFECSLLRLYEQINIFLFL